MNPVEIAEIVKSEVGALIQKLRAVNGGVTPRGIASLFRAAPEVVKHVEKLALEGRKLSGEDKKAVAVELLLAAKILPAWIPAWIVRGYLPDLIESAYQALKDKLRD